MVPNMERACCEEESSEEAVMRKRYFIYAFCLIAVFGLWKFFALATEGRNVVADQDAQVTDALAPGTARKILTVYFSQGDNADLPEGVDASSSASIAYWNGELTGNAGVIARMIHERVGGEIFPILTKDKYPSTFSGAVSVGLAEKVADARPELSAHVENMQDYNTIFLVYPAWWYKMPMPLYSFLDEYNLSGKVLYVCVSSESSGFTNEIAAVRKLEPNATVIRGISVRTAQTMEAGDAVNEWLDEVTAKW